MIISSTCWESESRSSSVYILWLSTANFPNITWHFMFLCIQTSKQGTTHGTFNKVCSCYFRSEARQAPNKLQPVMGLVKSTKKSFFISNPTQLFLGWLIHCASLCHLDWSYSLFEVSNNLFSYFIYLL
jgi:hypothetical protein